MKNILFKIIGAAAISLVTAIGYLLTVYDRTPAWVWPLAFKILVVGTLAVWAGFSLAMAFSYYYDYLQFTNQLH